MSTLAQLYTALILDLRRTDMGSGGGREQAKIDAVARAVELYADELFWFNRTSGTVNTVANTATAALPSGMRSPTVVSYLGSEIRKRPLEEVQAAYSAASPATSLPSIWAPDGSTLRFYPTPDAVYALSVYGIADLGVPASASSNAWTAEAYDLILNEAKVILCRGALRDPDGLALAKDGRDEALDHLRRETRRRAVSGLTSDIPSGSSSFNIFTGS